MRFDKPFSIKLDPDYNIGTEFNEDLNITSRNLGGIGINPDELRGDELFCGGKFNWHLYNERDSHKVESRVYLMRLWALQMTTQMVNDAAFVNEIKSEPKFNIDDEDREVFIGVIKKMSEVLHDDLINCEESLTTLKKYKAKF